MARNRSIHAWLLTVALMGGPLLCGRPAGALDVHRGQRRDALRQIQELEEQWRTAQMSGDVAAMDRLLSEDYVGISMTGQVNTKEQQLDRLRSRTMVLTRIDPSDVKIKLVGRRVAIVTSLTRVEGTSDGVSMNGLFRSTRVYQRVGLAGWKMTNFEATRVPNGGRGAAGRDSADAHGSGA